MTPHFTAAELACKCNCGMLPKEDFMERVERVRIMVGFPLPVSSAARCPAYNAKVSKTGTTGPHTHGVAIDLAVSGSDALRLLSAALAEEFTGIGLKQHGPHSGRFVHLDMLPDEPGQPRPWIWSYP